jgi:hypothetical protein
MQSALHLLESLPLHLLAHLLHVPLPLVDSLKELGVLLWPRW